MTKTKGLPSVNRKTSPSKWILVIEDDTEWQERFLHTINTCFDSQGDYLVVCVSTLRFAEAVLDAYATTPGTDFEPLPSAILVDCNLPGGDSPAFINWFVYNRAPNVPICAVSGIDVNNKFLCDAGASTMAMKGDFDSLRAFLQSIHG